MCSSLVTPGIIRRRAKEKAFLKRQVGNQTIKTMNPKKLIPPRKPELGEEKILSQGQPEGNFSSRESPPLTGKTGWSAVGGTTP